MRQKYWRFRLTFEIVKVRLRAVCKQSFLSHMPLTLYKTFTWHTFASLRLFTRLVYVSTYCVPIAHLRQNKPFPLLYLGHAQIITKVDISCIITCNSGPYYSNFITCIRIYNAKKKKFLNEFEFAVDCSITVNGELKFIQNRSKTAFEAKGRLFTTGKVIQRLFIIDLYQKLIRGWNA